MRDTESGVSFKDSKINQFLKQNLLILKEKFAYKESSITKAQFTYEASKML